MKKKLFVVAVVLMSSAAVFASGSKDDEQIYGGGYGRGPMNGGYQGDVGYYRGQGLWMDEDGNPVTPEEVSAEGTLILEEGTYPYLENGEEKVFLMVPFYALADLELEGGESVSVVGFDASSHWGEDPESLFLHVLSAEIDGETYTLDRGGRMGGRGGKPRGGRNW